VADTIAKITAAGEVMADSTVAMAPANSSWVGDTLDGAGAWSLRSRAPWLLGLLMLFDSWDSVVIAYVLPVLNGEWHLSALQTGWMVSAGYAGQFVGAIVFGSLAERCGRLPVLRWLVLLMSLLAVACAMASDYNQLIALRALQGLTIGGALPVAICYINELAPTATRGRFFGTFQFLMTSGFGLAALAGAWLIPAFGWRVMFAIGAAPLVVLPFTWMLPESPRATHCSDWAQGHCPLPTRVWQFRKAMRVRRCRCCSRARCAASPPSPRCCGFSRRWCLLVW
jgi:MFS transporter, putative metabolite:H+ symporter